MSLFNLPLNGAQYPDVLQKTKHISLKEDPKFQEAYVDEMTFPEFPPGS
jgi:hypothetical protein